MHRLTPRESGIASRRLSTTRLTDGVGVICALGYATLAYLASQPSEPGLGAFYGIVIWTASPVFLLYWYLTHHDQSISWQRLFWWAIAFRLCGLIGGPIYEDDFYRYLWDGYRFWTAGTPYGEAPETFFLDQSVPVSFHAILSQINYPELPTIYGPTNQLLFAFGYLIEPANVKILQLLLIIVDLAIVYLLSRLTSTRNVLLYAWCPLVIKEIAFTAHPDAIGICLVLAAIVLASKDRKTFSAICLGLAVGAKIFAVALVPFVLRHAGFRHWCFFVFTLGLLYAPFVISGGTDLTSLQTFALEWEFNAALFSLLTIVLPSLPAKYCLAALGGCFWLWCYMRYRSGETEIPPGDRIYGVLLLVAPVINPWYVLWVLPFAAIYPSHWAWTASVAVFLSYITGLTLGHYDLQPYSHPPWVKPIEFGAIGCALLLDWYRHRQARLQIESPRR